MSPTVNTQPKDLRAMQALCAAGVMATQSFAVQAGTVDTYWSAAPTMPAIYLPTITTPEPMFQAPTRPVLSFGAALPSLPQYVIAEPATKHQSVSIRSLLLKRDLTSYAGVSDGWDGEGSLAPSAEALSDAWAFLEQLPAGIAVPKAMLSSAGTPGLYWDERDYFIDIEFHGGGEVSLFAKGHAGSPSRTYSEHDTVREAAQVLGDTVKAILA